MVEYPERLHPLIGLCTRPVFILVDVVGICCLVAANLGPDPLKGALAAVGSALLAIGLSLPVALYYQLKSNSESLQILGTCNRAGIAAVFESRQLASSELRRALDNAVAKTNEFSLLGIAFRSLFNPAGEYTQQMRERLDDPRITLRVLILNPDSDAAQRRARIEQGNTTIQDIRFTLENGIPAVIRERILRRCRDDDELEKEIENAADGLTDDQVKRLANDANCKIRVYDAEPILFLMDFRDTLFTEQYHLGRPKELRTASCIGKHVPVIQYTSSSRAATFLRAHFETIWKDSEDRTTDVVKRAFPGVSKA